MSAAEHLQGLVLDGDWTVLRKVAYKPSSGGIFSVPYIVADKSGKEHFLKALDFSDAFNKPDPARALQEMTSAYNHERDILEHCKDRRLSRVVLAVTHGYAQVPGYSNIEGRVAYLIFELAESDVRKQVDLKNRLDCLVSLSILNDVTLGMMQLHREAIAHQDLKRSRRGLPHQPVGSRRAQPRAMLRRPGKPVLLGANLRDEDARRIRQV
jgi:hypothetical protein